MAKTFEAPVAVVPPDKFMTAEEKQAYRESVERARAQYEAGEAIPGEAVFEWLESWGKDNELPPPRRTSIPS